MNPLLDILLLLKMLLTCNYLRSICYELFVWISPIIFLFLFSSVPFKMHNTNDHTQPFPTGSISGWARIREKGLCMAKDWLCLSERILPRPIHTDAVAWRTQPPTAMPQCSQKSIFLGVHSCHLTLCGSGGGS